MRRTRRWRLFSGLLLLILGTSSSVVSVGRRPDLVVLGSWATYTTVRYFIAYAVYPGSERRSIALSLGIASSLSLLFVATLVLSFALSCRVTHHRPRLRSLHRSFHYVLQFLVSFFLIAPAIVNLVFVLVWRHATSSLSLRGRCHWGIDVVWIGVGGQCASGAPVFGVWLTAAILRLVLTTVVLVRRHLSGSLCKSHSPAMQVAYQIASAIYWALRWPRNDLPEDVPRMASLDMSQIAQCDAPSRPSAVLHALGHKSGGSSSIPQRSSTMSRMEAIPEFSDAHDQQRYLQERAGHDSGESSTLTEEDSNHTESGHGNSLPKSSNKLRRKRASRDAYPSSSSASEGSTRYATLPSNVGEGDLQGFADRFRDLVDQVSRELEESRLAENNTPPRTPPLHHVLDTHTPYMTIDEFGREVPCDESIAMLGGVIRRMPTIESVGSRERASLRSNTLVPGAGPPSAAPSSPASSRPPTRATVASFNDTASVSLASASQPSSRSNSLHHLRMPSELGELVRDALRARGQSRPLPSPSARPGSSGSLNGSGSGCSAEPRSRSNSLGASELLAPVTEHGELGREDVPLPLRPAAAVRRLPDTPEQLVVGERGERSRSLAGSAHSVSSTVYLTAGTSASAGGGAGGGGGGGTGTGSSGEPR